MDKDTLIADAVASVARMMSVAAITAPKTGGKNYVEVQVLEGGILKELGAAMEAFGKKGGKRDFDRDGRNVANSDAVVLIGVKNPAVADRDCGACGFETCNDLLAAPQVAGEFVGPLCAFRILDMGIALGSAVKTASLFNVDNRIMYRVGAVVRDMGLVDWELVMGIPLSVSGKSIFFDR